MAEWLGSHLARLADDVRAARQVLFFSDFDGTLVPIRNRPTECSLDPALRENLASLAKLDRVAIGIVSGRNLSDLIARVGLDGLAYAGNHGHEIQGPDFSFREPFAVHSRAKLDRLVKEIDRGLTGIAGAWIEHKGLTASVHYREVEQAAIPRVIDVVHQVAAAALDARQFVLRRGKAVLEVRPAVDWNKGKAVCWLVDQLSSADGMPLSIYLGDDDTDEDVFAALPSGVTIRVGESDNTLAKYSLRDPLEVSSFVLWLLGILTGASPNP